LKRPPNRKLVLAAAVLIVAAGSLLARPAPGLTDPAHTLNHIALGGR
jgi:hypothetical protein